MAVDPRAPSDVQPKPVGPPLARGVDRVRYLVCFFMSTAGILVALRALDRVALLLQEPGSVPILQPIWSGILFRWPWLVSHVAFGGVVGVASFMLSCMFFTVLDVSQASTKIQKDWFPSKADMLRAAVPQSAIYIAGNALGYMYGYQAQELPIQAPRLAVFVEQLILSFIVGDFLMYWEHRIMHTVPFLRNYIHSVHHAYHAPFGWAGGVVHPLEDAVVVLCQIATPLLFAFHPLAFWVFVAIWVHLLIEEHSGHDVPWAPYNWLPFASCPMGSGAAPHDIHHYKVTKNYGFVFCVWDHMFHSAEPVVEPPDLPKHRHRTWWEFRDRASPSCKSE